MRGQEGLSHVNLSGTNLSGADLWDADLWGADLSDEFFGDIRWDENTNWENVQGLDRARNVPEALKQQMGLSSEEVEAKEQGRIGT